MRRGGALRGFVALAAALAVSFVASRASATGRDPKQEKAIEQAVAAVDAALVDQLHAGNDAADRGDDAAAAKAYAAVHAGAPKVVDVTRRLGIAEARSGQPALGIAHCRTALAEDGSAQNHAALALALLANAQPTLAEGDAREATTEAQTAVTMAPEMEYAQTTACEVAAAVGDNDELAACSAKLEAMAPNAPGTHLFAALLLGHRGDIDAAESELDRAKAAGLSAHAYTETRVELERARRKTAILPTIVVSVVGGWVSLMFVLLVGGLLLGDASTRSPSRPVRALQRFTLVLSAAMFPLTAVLFTVALLAAVAGIVVTFLLLAHASKAIMIVVGVLALYVIVAALRALLAKVPARDRGTPVDLGKEKKLRKALDAIALEIGAPKIDEVHVRPDASIDVFERGGTFGHVLGRNRVAISIGVGALDGMTRGQLSAVIASALGVLRARGGAGGDVAVLERRSIAALVGRMEARGVAVGANPAWWLVRAYALFFDRVSAGAVAFQSEIVDRWTAAAFGSEALARGLEHVARREIETAARARGSVRDAIDGDATANLYAREMDGDVRAAVDVALSALAERTEAIEALELEGKLDPSKADAPAWSLFSDREALEKAMTERVRHELRELAGFGGDQPSSESSVARA